MTLFLASWFVVVVIRCAITVRLAVCPYGDVSKVVQLSYRPGVNGTTMKSKMHIPIIRRNTAICYVIVA